MSEYLKDLFTRNTAELKDAAAAASLADGLARAAAVKVGVVIAQVFATLPVDAKTGRPTATTGTAFWSWVCKTSGYSESHARNLWRVGRVADRTSVDVTSWSWQGVAAFSGCKPEDTEAAFKTLSKAGKVPSEVQLKAAALAIRPKGSSKGPKVKTTAQLVELCKTEMNRSIGRVLVQLSDNPAGALGLAAAIGAAQVSVRMTPAIVNRAMVQAVTEALATPEPVRKTAAPKRGAPKTTKRSPAKVS